MFDWNAYLLALGFVVLLAAAAWIFSIVRRDVSHVDSLWSLMILASLVFYLLISGVNGSRANLVLVMVSVWALRLSVHITVRNWGEGEDHRYRAIRENNEPHFWFKSLYIVFGLQAVLAWLVSLPAIAASSSASPLGWLDLAALVLWAVGLFFEALGDWQLLRFQRQANSAGTVLDRGLWRYTRHPNYFGEALLWWGIYLAALSAGSWWSILSPVLMTFLLLRVSGVVLLEKDITGRRPAYRDYVQRTNAFFPGPPSSSRQAKSSLNGV